jgi:hypothetical protein
MTPEKLEILRKKKEVIAEKLTDHVTRRNFILDQEFHLCYIDMAGILIDQLFSRGVSAYLSASPLGRTIDRPESASRLGT